MGRQSGLTGDEAYAILRNKNGGGPGGTSNYNQLSNKPLLNGVELSGNKTSEDYKIKAVVKVTKGENGVLTADKTFDEIYNLINEGVEVIANYGTLRLNFPLANYTSSIISFVKHDGVRNESIIFIKSSGSILYISAYITPSATSYGGIKADPVTDTDTIPVRFNSEDGKAYVSPGSPVQNMQNTDTEVTLQPNILYIFPEMESLTITLGTPSDTNVANEYHFFFTSGATATTLTLNDVLSDAYSIEANMKYEVSILENVAYIKGVATDAA